MFAHSGIREGLGQLAKRLKVGARAPWRPHRRSDFSLDIREQDDRLYGWTLASRSGLVADRGVEPSLAGCLVAASRVVHPADQLTVSVEGFTGGDVLAIRAQLNAADVALEIAQVLLTDSPGIELPRATARPR